MELQWNKWPQILGETLFSIVVNHDMIITLLDIAFRNVSEIASPPLTSTTINQFLLKEINH